MQSVRSTSPLLGALAGSSVAAAFVGGSAGASSRWVVNELIEPSASGWPWSTLMVNVVGCLAIGVAARRLVRASFAWDLVVTGVLGGFTTMSAFAVELNDLVDTERVGTAITYAAVTVVGGMVAVAVAGGPRPGRELRVAMSEEPS